MLDIIIYISSGTVIGLCLSWLIERKIKSFIFQMKSEDIIDAHKNSLNYSLNWKFYLIFTILIASLSVWRQFSPYFLNDIIFITTLFIVAQIDLKTMFIEGKIISYALIMRLLWLIYFEPHELLKYLSGLFFGAGLLYFVGFFYQTFRKRYGLGDGDASVLGLIGFWIGWENLGIVIFIAAVSGILVSSLSLLTKRKKKISFLKTKIPFAPFLCISGMLVYFFEKINFIKFGLLF